MEILLNKVCVNFLFFAQYMKTMSVRMYTFHNCENYVEVSHD